MSVVHMFEQIPCMSFVLSDREADGEPLVDNSVAKGRAEEVEKINAASSCLDMRLLLSEECGVALKRRVEKWRSLAHSCGA